VRRVGTRIACPPGTPYQWLKSPSFGKSHPSDIAKILILEGNVLYKQNITYFESMLFAPE